MDESRLKHKRLLSRKGSNQEYNIAGWPHLNVSPLTLHNTSKMPKNSNKDSGKAVSAYRIDLNNVQNVSHSRESSTKRRATPSRPLEKRPSFESSIMPVSQSRNDSSAVRNKSPASERVTPSLMEKVINQSLHKVSGSIRDSSEKMIDFIATHKQSHRRLSNPRAAIHNSYYMYKQPNSTRVDNKDSQKDLQVEPTRMKRMKPVWGSNESIEMSLSGLLGSKQQLSLTKRENETQKEKKKKNSLSISQVEKKPSVNKLEDSQLKLKDYCMYKNLNELQLGVSLGRELNNPDLAQKKKNRLFQKLTHNQSQKLNASQFAISYNKYFEEQQPVQQPNQVDIYEERVGTEEYYQDFFSMNKMSFNFEKARVSQRSKSQRDYFTPEATIVYSSNPSSSHMNHRDKSKGRSQGGMVIRGKGLE